jgi:glyoxylase-like metal-dependent hydrolase (beta-lactamase superfamily II)
MNILNHPVKNKNNYLIVSLILATSLSLLSACSSNSSSEKIISLNSGEVTKPQVSKHGMILSLDMAPVFKNTDSEDKDRSFHSTIVYFETLLSYGNNKDPRNTFVLVNEYLVSNQQKQGIAFFETLLKRYDKQLDDQTRAAYLAAYAILRATYADNVMLLKRIGWVIDTFDLLEQANRLSNNEDPLVHWAAGLVYAQVPFFFFKKEDAYRELNWLAERSETEPLSGFYREVYHHLARLHNSDGNKKLAKHYLQKSGYEDYQPNTLYMGWFTSTKEFGAGMAARPTITEVISDRVYRLYGFGFSDVHFVISDNGHELIAVDAGTQPGLLQAAHQLLKKHHANLPPITTVIVTHAHWDHIGGYSYLKSLNPNLKIYGRENYHGTLERVQRNHSYKQFRSEGFKQEWVKNYKPDVPISQRQDMTIDGTLIELIPVKGGETEDAMLVSFSDLGVIYVGDVLMPYYGEPWVEEGYIDGAIATMDEVIKRNPKHIIHGHHPLTVIYGPEQLKRFKDAFKWLVDTTREHIRNGYSAKEIVRLNLIPPKLQEHPEDYFSYLAPRDHIIARIADHMLGIWQENKTGQEPEGLDNLTATEYGRLLAIYLDLSAENIHQALEKMINNGDNELALKMAVAAEQGYGSTIAISQLKEEAANRLRSSAQFFDPFKFVVYTEMINKQHKPVSGTIVNNKEVN